MRRVALLAGLLLACSAAAVTATTRYQARELVQVVPEGYTVAYSIAADGTTAGQCGNRAVVWYTDGSTRLLDYGYEAMGINNHGCVAGMLSPAQAAFWDSDGLLHPLGTLPDFTESIAYDVNDSGKVAGYSRGPQVEVHSAFVWTSESGLMPLAGIGGYDQTIAFAVNAGGYVAGLSSQGLDHATDRPTLWDADGHATDMGTLEGYLGGHAQDINDAGWAVGILTYTDEGNRFCENAALWLPGGDVIEVGLPRASMSHDRNSRANGVNDLGQVVGQAKGEQSRFAFVWENGVLTDLNSVLAEPLSYILVEAYDINDAGQIVCGDGHGHAYVLTPVPEPSSLLGVVCGIAGLGALARRRLYYNSYLGSVYGRVHAKTK